jgi:flagellar hook-associated protein 3 FlgL
MNINTVANETPAGGAVGDPTDTAFALNTPIQLYDRNQTDSKNTASPYGNPQVNRIIPSTLSITGLTEGTDYSVDYTNGTVTFTSAAAQAQATAGTLNVNYEWVRRNELPNTNGTINCEVEPGINMNLNAKADDVFGKEGSGTDLFSSMISLMSGLQTSNQSQIESSMTPLDNSYNRLMGQETTVGASVNRLTSTTNRNTQNLNTTTSLQSNVEDLDFSKAISDFTMAQTVYQASLQSAVKVLSPNLMNYM